jgi:hypothetical protein
VEFRFFFCEHVTREFALVENEMVFAICLKPSVEIASAGRGRVDHMYQYHCNARSHLIAVA